MKGFKRLMSVLLIMCMIVPMCIIDISAADPLTIDETVAANWTPLAAKYSKSTTNIIAPKGDNYTIRTTGFDYSADADGGIKVHTATYRENTGVYSVAAVSSKHKTSLDGLSVELMPDDMTMEIDSNNASSNVSFIITENPITRIAAFDYETNSYNDGLYTYYDVAACGLRELAFEPGKSLVVTISNQKISNTDPHVATVVTIVYDDASYISYNGRTGYRWAFTSRNYTVESPNSDLSGIVQTYRHIDFSEGLKFEVRADERLGYIVSVNGQDFYSRDYIAYYPECSVNTFYGKENNTYYLDDSDYLNCTTDYLNSMTYAQQDIDLTGLGENFEGYVTVGATGTNTTTNNCDFTITNINTHHAATWQGEEACPHDAGTERVVTKEPDCSNGILSELCTICGKAVATEPIDPIYSHTEGEWITVQEPVCPAEGSKELHCSVCGEVIETAAVPAQHVYTEDIIQEPTCTEEGIALMVCTCSDYYTTAVPTIPHVFGNYTYNNDATCTEDGTKTASCEYGCGTADTVNAEGTASHSYVEEIVRSATCTKTGIRMMICDCGEYYSEDIPMLDHVYTDYAYNDDATCVADGTMTAYCDYGCGTANTIRAAGTITDHQYIGEVTVPATCTADGEMTYTCKFCEDSYTEVLPMTDHTYVPDVIKAPTCTSTGMTLYMCSCSKYYVETTPMADHTWGDWSVTTAPTDSSVGEEERTCSACSAAETRELPMLAIPVISVDNFTVTVSSADLIKDMRYAPGTYITPTEIKAADGNVAISNSLIVENTVDGVFTYEIPNGGYYTIWIRMTDGREYIMPLDVTVFTPFVSSYGVKVTVHNLYNVKDFYIAKGEFNTYREIKDNGYIFSATSAKIGTKHDYTCTVKEPGVHTVLIRYNDGTQTLFHETLTVDEPVFTVNGLQITVSNIPDVKVIRTAYGEYNTPGDTKRAEGARNFSNKSVIKNAESYMLQYREEGRVTIVVEYNNGYIKVFHHDIVKKAPTVVQNGDSVTFGNLDGLKLIRYAKGEYSTSNEIKKAPGSKYLKPDAIVNGKITVPGLTIGETYTFCVQYDDESYTYLTISACENENAFTLVFDSEGAEYTNDAFTEIGIDIGDRYADIISELPIAEKEGYVFKGWWNRERRIALTPDFDAEKVFDIFLGYNETVDTVDSTITLIPIWDTEGEKQCTLTFYNWDVEDFEPITYELNVGDYYMSVFAGDFPDPGEYWLDERTQFMGWYLEEFNYLLTEGDMWDLSYLALEGHWTLFALYVEVA